MAKPSPRRRSQLLSGSDRGFLSNFLSDGRNTEGSHRDALAAAQVEHARVRDTAIRVYELHELEMEHSRILEQERLEEVRLRAEAAIAEEEIRLQKLRAKSIPKPPPPKIEPPPPSPAEKPTEEKRPEPAAPISAEPNKSSTNSHAQIHAQPPAVTKPQSNGPFPGLAAPSTAHSNPFGSLGHETTQSQKPAAASSIEANTASTNTAHAGQPNTQNHGAQARTPAPDPDPLFNRYRQIHQALKQLRKDVVAASKDPSSPLKGKLGNIRRELRVSVGQLAGGKGANAQLTSRIMAILRQSLEGQIPSPPVQVDQFVAVPREPSDMDVPHNGTELPSFFIYLLNIIAKSIIGQFILECSANPQNADPIGVFTAQVFSQPDFSWRNESLIDILLAKFRMACPIMFGARGNDRTEKGRQALGWKRIGPTAWIDEDKHRDRMIGLAAGFAAISLRDFSRASKKNPFPPTNYWKALARIVNADPGDISATQLVVLRSMIDGYEQRFLNFYGNAAVAALRLALVEVPKKAPANSEAGATLRAMGDILREKTGLVLS